MSDTKEIIDISQTQKLARQERNRLQELEGTIKTNLKAFYEVGSALAEIRDSRLYRETYKTFEEYCRDRWDIGKPQAHRFICASNVVDNLVPIGTTPQTESQARPLTKLDPEQQVEAWQQAVETAPDGLVTAKHVKEVVNQITGKAKQETKKEGSDDMTKLEKKYDAFVKELNKAYQQNWEKVSMERVYDMIGTLNNYIHGGT